MASILRTFGIGKSKHKKLPEDWSDCKAPVVEGITFYCKYLGSTLVEEPSNDTITADAIKRIISMAKASSNKKLPQISLTVKPIGITTCDMNTGEGHLNVSIYRISYCSADATYDRVAAFIATNANETHECHAFLTSKRKISEAIALTISQAFTIAFEKWKQNKAVSDDNKNENSQNNGHDNDLNNGHDNDRNNCSDAPPLIDLTVDENAFPSAKWGFDDSFVRFTEITPENESKMRSNVNHNLGNFQQLSQYVRNETSESKSNDKFFADDDLFSL